MATQTAHVHPAKAGQMGGFYPHRVVFKRTESGGVQTPFLTSPCAYEAAFGGQSEEFESEAPTSDRLRLPAWQPEIAAECLAVLTLADATVKRFNVLDALPDGHGPSATIVLVTPK